MTAMWIHKTTAHRNQMANQQVISSPSRSLSEVDPGIWTTTFMLESGPDVNR